MKKLQIILDRRLPRNKLMICRKTKQGKFGIILQGVRSKNSSLHTEANLTPSHKVISSSVGTLPPISLLVHEIISVMQNTSHCQNLIRYPKTEL